MIQGSCGVRFAIRLEGLAIEAAHPMQCHTVMRHAVAADVRRSSSLAATTPHRMSAACTDLPQAIATPAAPAQLAGGVARLDLANLHTHARAVHRTAQLPCACRNTALRAAHTSCVASAWR